MAEQYQPTDEETQFSFSHQYSLSYLIKQTEKPIPPAEAIKLIDKKNGHEAIELLFSELFEKFKHLEACKQTISKVLPSLLHIGVTADHFALWNLDGIQFTEEHAELISKMKYFMKRTPEEAIRYICDERVTPEQAKELIITASRSRNADLDSALQSPHHQATDRQIEMLYNDLGRVKSFRI